MYIVSVNMYSYEGSGFSATHSTHKSLKAAKAEADRIIGGKRWANVITVGENGKETTLYSAKAK